MAVLARSDARERHRHLSRPALTPVAFGSVDTRRIAPSPARLERLAAELADDGVGFLIEAHRDTVLEELDYVLRPPVHEGRIPSYGSIVGPTTRLEDWSAETLLRAERRVTTDIGDAEVRRFADGISSFAVHIGGGVDELVVFDRSAGSERDLVVLANASGGLVIQRHPSGVVRAVGRHGVVRRDLTGWHHEPSLLGLLTDVPGCTRGGAPTALGRLLDFAVHDLGSLGIGSFLIMHPTGTLTVPHEARLPTPPALSITLPHDLAPLRHALGQTDGAAVFDDEGTLRHMGIRVIPSRSAEEAVRPIRGTRHTSARRFSFDQSDAVVITVSDDGPVTVFRGGEILGHSVANRVASPVE